MTKNFKPGEDILCSETGQTREIKFSWKKKSEVKLFVVAPILFLLLQPYNCKSTNKCRKQLTYIHLNMAS